MNLEEFFSLNTEEEKPLKITIADFVNKTRIILAKIEKEYGATRKWRRVTEDEYEKQDCDNCKGECAILKNGFELHCVPNKEEGECFVLEIQHEAFLEEIENVMFHDDSYSFFDLLSCEVVNEVS
jgi:hypothetical protein